MALKAYFTQEEYEENKETLEPLKEHGIEYTPDSNGRLVLQVEPRDGVALDDVKGLQDSVASAREERDKLHSRLYEFGNVEPKTVKEALDKAKKFDELNPEAKAGELKKQFDDWKTEFQSTIQSEHEQQLSEKDARVQALSQQLEGLLVEGEAQRVLADPEINGSIDLLLPVIRNQTVVVEEDGQPVVKVLNPNKPGQYRVGKSGGDMTLKELIVDELMQDSRYQPAFGARSASGAGEQGSSTPPAAGRRKADMSEADKARYIRQHGREAYRNLP